MHILARCFLAVVLVLPHSAPAEWPGVIVVAEPTDPDSLVTRFGDRSLIMVIAGDTSSRKQLDRGFRAAGRLGQLIAVKPTPTGRIPLADHSAAAVYEGRIAGLAADEFNRVLRPFGVKHQGDARRIQPRPPGMDDWNHFHKDPANSEHSRDTHVGHPKGLQWISGPTNAQDFNLVHRETVLAKFRPIGGDDRRAGIMARDAFNGLSLWIREDLSPLNRFAIVMDDERVIIQSAMAGRIAPRTVALNRLTGETVQRFDEGFDFTVTDEQMKADRRAMQNMMARAEDLQFRLSDGVLVQCLREEVIVLDAVSGKRLWSRAASEGLGFVHPTVGNETLYLVEGLFARRSSYTHWPMAEPDRIYAFDLRTGEPQWETRWDDAKFGRAHAIYNLQIEGDKLAGAVTVHPPEGVRERKPWPHGLILDARDGSVMYWGREKDAWPGNTGHGHSHVRLHLRGDQAWTMSIGQPIAFWTVGDAKNFTSFKALYSGRDAKFESGLRPVSCTVWRSTPNWWFGGVNCYPMAGDALGWFNRSGRSNCDIGAFPANGLLYSPPNTCQCQPYLPAIKAYHSREPARPRTDHASRLIAGDAEPAKGAKSGGWPQWQRDTERRGWSDETLSTDPKLVWQKKFELGEVPDLLRAQWEADAVAPGPITQASAAEGVVIIAETHRQSVIAVDPATGEEKWRTPVDGRVDSQPSIFNGAVYVGTRHGWVYCLARDSGELIWKFFAAPADDRMVVNGQFESVWPVFGAVPVDARGVMVVAGRHTDTDGGMRWWQLDPATGKTLADGKLGGGEAASTLAANWPRKIPIQLRPMQNTVPIMNADWFMLPRRIVRRNATGGLGTSDSNGRLTAESFMELATFDKQQRQIRLARYGANAMLGERRQNTGGWRKPLYANTLARIYAIRGNEFISVGGGLGTASGRGGGGDSTVHRMRWIDEPVKVKGNPQSWHWSEVIWEHKDNLLISRGLPSVSAMAVSDNAIYLGASIYISGRRGEEEREKMAHRLRILDLETGALIRELPVPDRVLQGGIALAEDRIIVASEDGSLTVYR